MSLATVFYNKTEKLKDLVLTKNEIKIKTSNNEKNNRFNEILLREF